MGAAKRIATARQLGQLVPAGVLALFTPSDEAATTPIVDPTITPPWIEEPTTRPEPDTKPERPAERAEVEEIADDGDGLPTRTSCAPGWYRRGDTFYPLGRGPFPAFGLTRPDPEPDPEPAMVAAPTGPAVQLTLF